MTDNEFYDILAGLRAHLSKEKVFIKNPLRAREMTRAMEIIAELFPDRPKRIENDPLQMGSVIFCVDGCDMVIRGQRELKLFSELCSLINNFGIYPIGDESVCFEAMMREVYIDVAKGN